MNLLPYTKERICNAVIGIVSEELAPSSVFTTHQMLENIADDEIIRYLQCRGYDVSGGEE